jgi:predicted transcriptional regulator
MSDNMRMKKKDRVDLVARIVSGITSVPIDLIFSRKKGRTTRDIVDARKLISVSLIREYKINGLNKDTFTLSEVGKFMGVSHCAIIHYIKKHDEEIDFNKIYTEKHIKFKDSLSRKTPYTLSILVKRMEEVICEIGEYKDELNNIKKTIKECEEDMLS